MFDSIPELIKYYQKVPLFAVRGIRKFEEVLTFAVPRKVRKILIVYNSFFEHFYFFLLILPPFFHLIPSKAAYETQLWFNKNVSKEHAEDMLTQMGFDGSFLVRPSSLGHNESEDGKKTWALSVL